MTPARVKGCTLLLVDDEPANLDLLEALLASEGYTRLARVADARQAIPAFEAFRPDLVLLDLHMPHRSGYEILSDLRDRTAGEDFLPVLVLTADVTPGARERALTLGARDFVTKPFDAVEVLLRVQNLLETRVLYREQRQAAERASLLAEASRVLGASFDTCTALQQLARLLVPRWAEACAVDLCEGGRWRRVAAAAGEWIAEMQLPDGADAALDALLRGEPGAGLGERLGLPEAGAWSCAPLRTAGGTLGLLTVGGACAALRDPLPASAQFEERPGRRGVLPSPPRFGGEGPGVRGGPADLLAELGHRAALAVENARLYAASEAATRSRDRVLATVAHDLRNPLAGIRMGTEMLLETLPEEGADYQRASLADVQRSAGRLERMIQDLLEVARVEAGTLCVAPRAQPLEPILEETARDFAALADAAGLSLRVAAAPLPPVRADAERVQQVLANLVGNAIKFTPAGGSVTISAAGRGGEVCVSVRDTGPGIAAEQLPFLFASFWQANADRRGVGLGLSIAQALVEAHGGRIWAESAPGAGSTFHFTLPAVPNPEPTLPA